MADRYLIENREAAVGVQVSGGRKHRSCLGGGSALCPGGGRPGRGARRTQRRRPAAGRTPAGLALEASAREPGRRPKNCSSEDLFARSPKKRIQLSSQEDFARMLILSFCRQLSRLCLFNYVD
jgi:hypothetical protein